MNTAIIAFGSNLSNPIQQIRQAIETVRQLPHIHNMRVSPLYQTAPVGYKQQPDFINAVALVETDYAPITLLHVLHSIENQFGRQRSFPNAPRTLDLDIIDYNKINIQLPKLQLPHPRAHERIFVMRPLADIAPEYTIGTYGSAEHISAHLSDDGIQQLIENENI